MNSLLSALFLFYVKGVLPFAFLIGLILVIIATFGIDCGVHRIYVQYLLRIFEFCRQAIAKKARKARLVRLRNVYDDSSDDEKLSSQLDYKYSNIEKGIMKFPTEDEESTHEFELSDAFEFIRRGVKAIIDDEVTKRFSAEELQTWNLLTRTNKNYHFVSFRLTVIWLCGWLFRFGILFPIRCVFLFIGMVYLIVTCAAVGMLPEGKLKRSIYRHVSITAFRILSRSVSAVINFHNTKYKPKQGSLCVANHTSPVDAVFLHTDNAYALVGQLHGGFLGVMERALSRATSHIFFDRFEVRDRQLVASRIQAHVRDPNKLPILIFPEGTCINNSAVMMFKKGSFEGVDVVYPVAVKYNHIFGDSFWDSSKYGFFTYLMMMMSSWAIVLDIWYLPPMTKEEGENAVDFANRVKSAIAKQGGLIDLDWDGQLKRQRVKPDLKAKVQIDIKNKENVFKGNVRFMS
ncbi:Glycerol-3-phosphate acyltransferase 4-like protein [Dinothrombium tinctorium]|uniref:Glycerol-3-phosphate acyltransferase 4-like protein n=1 Tax=Dinothrombium tinctorium TaxID=1965070 RepID=A0A3S3P8J8_9ACAR|nr:Glycerol-3-phosphate acyltransferase 4-like protein [Dinothrombium tinctorium]